MNEQNFPQQNELPTIPPTQGSKNVWIFILVVFFTALIGAGSSYLLLKSNFDQEKNRAVEQTRNEMQKQIDLLQSEVTNLKNNQNDIADQPTNNESYSEWISYTDPENIYSIKVPKNWQVNSQWEQGNDLPDDRISYTSFSRKEGYMILNISKLYSHTPEYNCEPKGGDLQVLSPITIDGYKTYQSYSIFNVDTDYKETTSYNYCINVKGKKLHFEFVPQASDNNQSGVMVLYDILDTIDFK